MGPRIASQGKPGKGRPHTPAAARRQAGGARASECGLDRSALRYRGDARRTGLPGARGGGAGGVGGFTAKGAYGNVTEELFVLTLLYCTRLLALTVWHSTLVSRSGGFRAVGAMNDGQLCERTPPLDRLCALDRFAHCECHCTAIAGVNGACGFD